MKTILSFVVLILLVQVQAKPRKKCKDSEVVVKKCLQYYQNNPIRYHSCVEDETKLCNGDKTITKRSRVVSECTHFKWTYKEVKEWHCNGNECHWLQYKVPVKICTMS